MFFGADRQRILGEMLEKWRLAAFTASPQLMFLVGEPGYGKTKLVHEFYRSLAAEQKTPAYWPESIGELETVQDLSISLRNTRKLVFPEDFEIQGSSTPEFLWLGTVLADNGGVHTDSGLDDIIKQLSFHLAPLMQKKEFQAQVRKVAKSVAGMIPLMEAIELATDVHTLISQTSQLFQKTSMGGSMTRNAGYEERLAAFYRSVRMIWGPQGDKGPPAVLVIEDFHAAHEPTVALIRHILGAANLPFLIVACSQRQALAKPGPAQLLADTAHPSVTRIDVEKLDTEDIAKIARRLLPATSDHLIYLLAGRADGNPYSLKLQVLALRRLIHDGHLEATARDIAALPIEIDGILLALWHQLPTEHQHLLGLMAIIGHKAPEAIDQMILAAGQVRSGASSGWVRYAAEHRVFVEVARWQLAKQHSLPLLTAAERRQAVTVGMDAVIKQLQDSSANRSFEHGSLLRSCLENLLPEALHQQLNFDRLAVAEEMNTWGQTLHWNRMHEEALQILMLSERTLDHPGVRRSTRGLELMCMSLRLQCAATRLLPGHGYGHPAAIESAQSFLDWAEDAVQSYPPAIVQAHAAMSRACRLPDNDEDPLIERSKRELDEARRLFGELKTTDVVTRLDLLSASYPWLARTGRRREAAAAATEVAELARLMFGEDSPRVDMALHDAAFYTRRLDPELGIQSYRVLLEKRLQRWGDESHPVVAVQMKDLAAALLRQGDEEAVTEAATLLESAYASLLRHSGPEGRDTAVTESILALALVRLATFMDKPKAKPTLERALKLAEESLQLRKAGRPKGKHLPQRSTLAIAKLANSNLEGFNELEDILADRTSQHEEPHRIAEIRWQAAEMAKAYKLFGNHIRAGELEAQFRLHESDSAWLQ